MTEVNFEKRFWRPLKINPEYVKLVPKLSSEDYNALEASIIANRGAFEPIKINSRNEILDGHTRYDICTKNTVGFTTELINLSLVIDEKIYVIETNLKRRQLNRFQSIELNLVLEPLLAEKGRKKESESGKIGRNIQLGVISNDTTPTLEKIDTLGTIAEKSKVGRATVAKVKKILEKAPEELKQRVRENKTSIAHAYNIVVTKQKHVNPKPLPEGTYSIIYADPPWQYDLQKRGSTLGHYEDQPLTEICALKVPSTEDSILFLWATNPKLQEALKVMNAWGFEYKTNLVWVKDKFGTGYYVRGQHELLLIGVKGSIGVPEEQNRPSSVLHADRHEHSEKPLEVYGLIEKMYPNHKYLELFARKKRDGWAQWGKEFGEN